MPPANIKLVVCESEHQRREQGDNCRQVLCQFIVREAVEGSACLQLFRQRMQYNVLVSTTRCDGNEVLVEGCGDEHDDYEEVDDHADGAHGFWSDTGSTLAMLVYHEEDDRYVHFNCPRLAHIFSLQTITHECLAHPSYEAIRGAESNRAVRQSHHNGISISIERVCDNGNAREEDGEERELLLPVEFRGHDRGVRGVGDIMVGGRGW